MPLNSVDEASDALAFDPVPLRYRQDGLTPEKQREYVEALADTGVARAAAARIGVSEQAVNRVRRRADARAFDLACEAALRHGARRLRAIAFERAIEGTVKRHHYHGEVVSEERVYDNRLLIYLLGKTAHLLDEPEEARAVADCWEPWVEAMERGEPAPALGDGEGPEPDDMAYDECETLDVWEDEGLWWTNFPPPGRFAKRQQGEPGDHDYRRGLTEEEEALVEAGAALERSETVAAQTRCRDLYFADIAEALAAAGSPEDSFPREAETYETSGDAGAG